ncbi:hypothetical protein ECZU51_60930 [Escherichia coli]|nr:hypothetical protein ECZU51_60930 [Escherichia coli]
MFALMWLQSWPLLYAILNSAMTFYAKQNGAPVVLSEISQIQLKYSDLASTAGYLSMMIPPLSWMMVRGLGAGFSSVYSHFASSAISPTASAAGSVVDGNYSYGNMQTENVNGFSWSTNSTTSFGQMMYQTGSGATATQTRDGNMVMDASGAMSRFTGRYQCNASDCSGTTGNGPGGVEQSRKCPAWFQQQYCQCLEHAQSVWF